LKPASDDSVFKTRLKELVAIGKKKKGVLEYKEIMDYLGDVELDADQIEKVYEFFEGQGIDVLGIVDMEEEVEKEIDNVFPIYANGEYYWIYLKLMYENSYKRREGITKLTFYTASDYYYYYHCDDTVITDEPITICNSSNTDGVVSIENYPQRIIDNRTIKLEDVKDQLEKTKSLGSFQKRFGSAPVADSDDLSCHYLLPDENGEKRYLKFVYDKGEIIAANVLDEFYFLEALLEEE